MASSSKAQLHLVRGKRSSAPELKDGPTAEPLRVTGLFAGIGGFELGLAAAEHETNLACEIDPAAAAVLDARFPAIPRAGDVRELRELPHGTDMIVAGFPCQDLSQAGRTEGISGERSGLIGE